MFDLILSVSMLVTNVTTETKGKSVLSEQEVVTTTVIQNFPNALACKNAVAEMENAYGAYQMIRKPSRIISAICMDKQYGSVQ